MTDLLDAAALDTALADLPDWRPAAAALISAFVTPTAGAALALVAAIGAAAEEANHHPDVDWRYDRVFVRTTSHDVGGITGRDTALAARISVLAGAAGATAEPAKARPGA